MGRVGLLRARRRLPPGPVRLRPDVARVPPGDRGARVLPCGAVRVRLVRGPRAHGGHGHVDGGAGLPGRHRPDQLPRPQRPRAAGRPARHRLRRLRVRRLALLALPDREGLRGRPDDHPRDLGAGRRRSFAGLRRRILLPGRPAGARGTRARLPQHLRRVRLDERPARLRGGRPRLPGRSARNQLQLRPLPPLDGLAGTAPEPPLDALLPLPPRRPSARRRSSTSESIFPGR